MTIFRHVKKPETFFRTNMRLKVFSLKKKNLGNFLMLSANLRPGLVARIRLLKNLAWKWTEPKPGLKGPGIFIRLALQSPELRRQLKLCELNIRYNNTTVAKVRLPESFI